MGPLHSEKNLSYLESRLRLRALTELWPKENTASLRRMWKFVL